MSTPGWALLEYSVIFAPLALALGGIAWAATSWLSERYGWDDLPPIGDRFDDDEDESDGPDPY